jgi:hypothetical protein
MTHQRGQDHLDHQFMVDVLEDRTGCKFELIETNERARTFGLNIVVEGGPNRMVFGGLGVREAYRTLAILGRMLRLVGECQ